MSKDTTAPKKQPKAKRTLVDRILKKIEYMRLGVRPSSPWWGLLGLKRKLQGKVVSRSARVTRSRVYKQQRRLYLKFAYRFPEQDRTRALQTEFQPLRRAQYDFATHDESLFLNDVERWMTRKLNGDYRMILNDKYLSYQILAHHARIAEIYVMTVDGEVHFQHPAFAALLAGPSTSLFVKPNDSSGGTGAETIVVERGSVRVGGKSMSFEQYLKRRAIEHDTIMVVELLKQSAFAAGLFPDAINTLRMLTMRDPKTGRVFVHGAVQRIGTKASAPVDNFSRGGMSFAVDMETGRIGKGTLKTKHGLFEKHPDTGVQITGQVIPNFAMYPEEAIRMHQAMPYINYVGWDLCHGPDGEIIVVEANNTSDVDLFQIHQPILADSRAVKFYRYHRII